MHRGGIGDTQARKITETTFQEKDRKKCASLLGSGKKDATNETVGRRHDFHDGSVVQICPMSRIHRAKMKKQKPRK